jgi:oxaloacetate decarboxylase beta subunit
MDLLQSVQTFLGDTGVAQLFANGPEGAIKTLIMIAIAGVLIYLAIGKGFEPLLLLPIAIGMLLTNIPGVELFHSDWYMTEGTIDYLHILNKGELLDILYIGVKTGLYPCLIFIGIGAMTDFAPLISNPKSLLIGAGAQLGVFVAFSGAIFLGFSVLEAASIGIIGGADGPTAIYVTKTLAPALLGAIAVAAYSYMALIPMIQPPIMRLLTTEKERKIKMTALRPVSKLEKMIFPVMVTVVVGMIVPSALSLIGCLMFGNILNVCGVTDRLSKTVQNGLMNAVTVCLGISVGATATAESFLAPETLLIIVLGLTAFTISTIGGLLTAKIMNKLSGGTINPLIGSAGVSAVPMAARVAQAEGQKADPSNFLLMHAMGPNVAGVIGSAVAAGVLLACFG